MEQLSDAVDRLTASKDVSHAALALMRRGRIRYEMGQVNESVNDLDQAMTISKDAGDPRAHAAACAARGPIHSETDELTEAFALLNTAAECFQRIGMPVTVLETVAADLQGVRPGRGCSQAIQCSIGAIQEGACGDSMG